MRYDTTRDDMRLSSFVAHQPHDSTVAAAWTSLITAPGERALHVAYGELVEESSLEELFHYRPRAV